MWLGFVIISVVGTLAHFLYDFSHHNKIVGLFAAVNESTWEHIKIALTPTFLWSLYDGYLYGANANYFLAKFLSLLAIVVFIPLIFYTYRIFTKKSILFVDITLFYITIFISQYLFYFVLQNVLGTFVINYLACIGIFILFGFYMVLTLLPIKNFLFKDPLTNKYGFKGHKKDD